MLVSQYDQEILNTSDFKNVLKRETHAVLEHNSPDYWGGNSMFLLSDNKTGTPDFFWKGMVDDLSLTWYHFDETHPQ